MSATGHGAIRVENDFYPTPDWCISAIVEKINWPLVRSMMEPCKGEGAILDQVPAGTVKYWAEITEGIDYLKTDVPKTDLTLTNPPFFAAPEFLVRSLAHSPTVVYLLRINFLGSAERKALLTANPPSHLYVHSKRPSFVDVCDGLTIRTTGASGKVLSKEKKKGCGWAFQKKAQVKECPNCGGKVKAGTDSIEYAWMVWDRGGIMIEPRGVYIL